MSQLYIRVKTSFYAHRKTARLRALLGPDHEQDAFWIPPRLWAYAAENQPDGQMGSYASAELASLLGCYKHATSILQALKDSGFLDLDGKIHDWEEHNGYHEKYAARAKTAADARWGKKEKNQKKEVQWKGESGDKHCLALEASIACSIATSINDSKPSASKVSQMALECLLRKWFKRRPDTQFSERELKMVVSVSIMKTPEEDIAVLDGYYSSDAPYKRKDILTLLNNWNGEIDRAKDWKSHGKHQIAGKPNTRNLGTIAGPTDYAAAARRKSEANRGNLGGTLALPELPPSQTPGTGSGGV